MGLINTNFSSAGSTSLFERMHRFWLEIHKPEFTGDGMGSDFSITPSMNIKIGKIISSKAENVGSLKDMKTSIKLLGAEDSFIRGVTSETSSTQKVPANIMAPCVLIGILSDSECAEILLSLFKASNIEDIVISKAAQDTSGVVPEKTITYADCKILGSYYRFSREWVFAFTYGSVNFDLQSFDDSGAKVGAKSAHLDFATRKTEK